VGNDGETLVADSSTSTGLRYQGNFAAGKNKIINGDFNIWQRGTSFNYTTTTINYTADRWLIQCNLSSGTSTVSQQTFTPGTAPVAGYEGQYFLRVTNSAGATSVEFQQRVEDVRTFAGQTVTISFWAKASSAVTMANTIIQNFGSGGSGAVSTTGTSQTLTTSWARYSTTINVPSVSGKTIGSGSYIQVYPMYYSSGTIASNVIDIWGVQIEAGSVATAFQTATGTIQGELAACQRYYFRNGNSTNYNDIGLGNANTTSGLQVQTKYPVQMRIAPTAIDTSAMSSFGWEWGNTGSNTPTSITIDTNYTSNQGGRATITKSGAFTIGYWYALTGNASPGYIGWSAEL
jgi:hypothetical protein